MKISFAITVCNELDEIKKLVPFLLEHKRSEDEIVVLYDEKNGNTEILEFLSPLIISKEIKVEVAYFNNNFSEWKNLLNSFCSGDYVYQIDADEMIDEYMVKNISAIVDMNPNVDLIFVPRINTVNGLTDEHVKKWGWNVNEKNWVNFPDWQGRIYRSNMSWHGKVHERIIGGEYFSSLPTDEVYCLQHHKSIDRQEKQNNLYSSI